MASPGSCDAQVSPRATRMGPSPRGTMRRGAGGAAFSILSTLGLRAGAGALAFTTFAWTFGLSTLAFSTLAFWTLSFTAANWTGFAFLAAADFDLAATFCAAAFVDFAKVARRLGCASARVALGLDLGS